MTGVVRGIGGLVDGRQCIEQGGVDVHTTTTVHDQPQGEGAECDVVGVACADHERWPAVARSRHEAQPREEPKRAKTQPAERLSPEQLAPAAPPAAVGEAPRPEQGRGKAEHAPKGKKGEPVVSPTPQE